MAFDISFCWAVLQQLKRSVRVGLPTLAVRDRNPLHAHKPTKPTKHQPKLFKYRHYEAEIILLCVRWYLRYSLSYRDLEEIMVERGLSVDHTTIYRRVQRYAPIFEKKCRVRLRPTNDPWRLDETYIKVKGVWMYLYRAVDSAGDTVEFMLSPRRNIQAAKRFFRKALRAKHTLSPRVINMDRTTWTATPRTRRLWANSRRKALCHLLVSYDPSSI